tara:strand:+ start:6850 stop:7683 length:834 start_codon:yes stop_codon:yes gene_type:complete
MNFKKDFKIKPKEVRKDGTVLFTDGTNNLVPNQLACEAYGYKYDTATGSCTSFKPTVQLDQQLKEPSNTIKGVNNTTNKGTSRSIINGTLNTTKGFNENCFISGVGNTINNGINNATVIGAYGKAIRQGEFVRGGGASNKANEPQSSIVQLTCNTTDNTTTNMKVLDLTDEFINLQNNSILGFEIYLTRLEIGGASGTAGNFSYKHIEGVIKIDNVYTTDIIIKHNTLIGKVGVTGTVNVVDVATGTISIAVSDRAGVNNIWNATVYLHETKTNITF